MKFLRIFFFVILMSVAGKSLAANPGSNYGCLVWNERLYTHYLTDAYAPNNAYWGPFHYYDELGPSYQVDYGSSGCGKVNPSNFAQFLATGQTCFVSVAGGYRQGVLGTYNKAALCELPIDDYVLPFLLLSGGLGYWLLTKKTPLTV